MLVHVKLDPSEEPAKNYAGVGLRYTLACNAVSGYSIRLYQDGSWALLAQDTVKARGSIGDFDPGAVHALHIKAEYNVITAWIDGEPVAEYVSRSESLMGAGRGALYSAYHRNCFSRLVIRPTADAESYITRYDNTDVCFAYEGAWEHQTATGFKHYKRTISQGKEGAVCIVRFVGTGFSLFGETGKAVLSVVIDGGEPRSVQVCETGPREISYRCDGLAKAAHTVRITVAAGTYSVDGMEVIGGEVPGF